MPIDFKLDQYGDIDLSTGDLSFVEDAEEVAQLIQTRVLRLYDEDKYAPGTGIKWFGKDGMYDITVTEDYQKLQIRNEMIAIPEVKDLPILTLDKSKHQGDPVQVVFVANTDFGEITAVNE